MRERPPTFENSPPPEDYRSLTPEPLLTESWHRVDDREHGEDNDLNEPKGRDHEAYNSIVSQIDSLPEGEEKIRLKKLFDELVTDIASYIRTIAVLKQRKIDQERTAILSADKLRQQAHTRLIDDLNILSRNFGDAGLDNLWRSDIGLTRKDATRWAVKVAQMLISEDKTT